MYLGEADGAAARVPEKEEEVGGDVIRPLYQDPAMYLGEADGPAARVPEEEDEVGGDVIRPEDGDLVIVGVRDRVLTHRHIQQRTRTNHLRQ
jgi:hypothetical protein